MKRVIDMGYSLTTSPENAVPPKSLTSSKTHTPGSPVKERGHRYFSPEIGRWIGRDPIKESAFVCVNRRFLSKLVHNEKSFHHGHVLMCVYHFAENNAINMKDLLGLDIIIEIPPGGGYSWRETKRWYVTPVAAYDDSKKCCSCKKVTTWETVRSRKYDDRLVAIDWQRVINGRQEEAGFTETGKYDSKVKCEEACKKAVKMETHWGWPAEGIPKEYELKPPEIIDIFPPEAEPQPSGQTTSGTF